MASDYLSLDDLGRVGHLEWALHKHSYPVGKRMVPENYWGAVIRKRRNSYWIGKHTTDISYMCAKFIITSLILYRKKILAYHIIGHITS